MSDIRNVIHRIRKRMSDAFIVVGLWHVDRDSPPPSALRSEGTDEHITLSIGELLAFVRSLTAPSADATSVVLAAAANEPAPPASEMKREGRRGAENTTR